jgi:hypothetical protein
MKGGNIMRIEPPPIDPGNKEEEQEEYTDLLNLWPHDNPKYLRGEGSGYHAYTLPYKFGRP